MFSLKMFSPQSIKQRKIEKMLRTLESYSITGRVINIIDDNTETPNFLNRIEYCWVKHEKLKLSQK